MEFSSLLVWSCIALFSFSAGLEISSKVSFEDEESTTETDADTSESRDVEFTTKGIFRRKGAKKTEKLKDSSFEAKIPVLLSKDEKKYEVKIPVKLEAKKSKPKSNVKFYKGTKVKNDTTTTTEETATDPIPVVKGSFQNIKPDFLVPIPKETILHAATHTIQPPGNVPSYLRRVWSSRLQTHRPEFIEGLVPPDYAGQRDYWNLINCESNCDPQTGANYPNVGNWNNGWNSQASTWRPQIQGSGNGWSSQGTGWNSQFQGGNWNPQGNGWSSGQGSWGQQNNYWGHQNHDNSDWGSQNNGWGSWGPPPSGSLNWGSQGSGNSQWDYNRRPNTRPMEQGSSTGKWFPCRPFEIPSSRQTQTSVPGCPQNQSPPENDKYDLPPAVTPASKIDDKTLFQNDEKMTELADETKAKLLRRY